MNLKKITLFILILTLFSFHLAFSQRRNLKTPLSRLVGHWVSTPYKIHYYFSPIDDSTLMGIWVTIMPKDFENKELAGQASNQKFSVISQEPEGEKITIIIDPENHNLSEFEQKKFLYISKDGNRMQQGDWVAYIGEVKISGVYFTYVDSKTSPDK